MQKALHLHSLVKYILHDEANEEEFIFTFCGISIIILTNMKSLVSFQTHKLLC